jgi:hypothetical protein
MVRRRLVPKVEPRRQSLTPHIKTALDTEPLPWYAVGMMKVGDLVRFEAPDDVFHGKKGIIVRCVESNMYQQGRHYELQTLDGHVIVALDFELERLENDVE